MPRRRRRRAPRLAAGTYAGFIGADDDLGEAARVIADAARGIAAGNGMPATAASISIISDGRTAMVYSDAPAAYPNEVQGVRHPVFGRPPRVTNDYRPFLAPAADLMAGAAMDAYAAKLDLWLKKAGFS
jgi:hypothetical protein